MTKIKICGLFRPADIEIVNESCPDYIGFVFAKSKRQINDALAGELKALLNPAIQSVGVFINDDINRILRLCREGIIDIVQLHGEEGAEYITNLKRQISNPIIKAVRIKKNVDMIMAAKLLPCDYLLFDTFKADSYGGSGETFDWSVLPEVKKPFFLAGGINSGNVSEAVTRIKPYAVDVSSGAETDGVKDRNKIIEIITKVRSVR